MAFPVDAGRVATNITAAATSWTVNLPASIAAGDLLVMHARLASDFSPTTPDGWTKHPDGDSIADASNDRTVIYYRKADGSEGSTMTFAPGGSTKGAAIVWRITGAEDPATQAPELSAVATGTGTGVNPDVVTPTGGAKDYLFLWLGGWEGEQTSPPSGTPLGFVNAVGADSGTAGAVATNCRVAGASRQDNVSSFNPGAWTISASDDWTAWTMAVHPAAAVSLVTFDAAVAGQAALAADASVTRVFAATAAAAAAITANESVTRAFEATVAGQSVIAGEAAVQRPFAAAVAGLATLNADFELAGGIVDFAAAVTAGAEVLAGFDRQPVFGAAAAGGASVQADIAATRVFVASVVAGASLAAAFHRQVAFNALASGQATIVADDVAARVFAAVAQGQAVIVAAFEIEGQEATVIVGLTDLQTYIASGVF